MTIFNYELFYYLTTISISLKKKKSPLLKSHTKKFVSYLKPGTQFLLSSQMIKEGEEDTNDRYIVGHVSSKIPRVFAGENQNTFTPICVPYKEKTIRYPKQITQNQHTLD